MPPRLPRLALALLCHAALLASPCLASPPIDRESLVRRHNPVYTSVAQLAWETQGPAGSPHHAGNDGRPTPLQVGNGRFAFSVDITGLQTFSPCNTLSDWGWHRAPLPEGRSTEEFPWTNYRSDHGRPIPFPWTGLANDAAYQGSRVDLSPAQREMGEHLRANPHRLNLGRLSLELLREDGSAAKPEELRDLRQELDLWTGVITSSYSLGGVPVRVTTASHPDRHALAVRIESPLLAAGRARVRLRFPYGDTRGFVQDVGDWGRDDAHGSEAARERIQDLDTASVLRTLDDTRYLARLAWPAGAAAFSREGAHHFVLAGAGGNSLEFSCEFSPLTQAGEGAAPAAAPASAGRPPAWTPLPFLAVLEASRTRWPAFWRGGAALDFSGSRDPRAHELERRVVLSQYLMAVQEAGELPPQEAGLVNNGWYGKFHLEMFWWHAAHQALWNRWDLLEPSLRYYDRILPKAEALARRQGFRGARWPKMTGPDGEQSPSSIAPFLIWQQPHPLFFAELDYRRSPSPETLARWDKLVTATADFMADLPVWDARQARFNLGAPLKTVPENTRAEETRNPAFELAYWRFGLRIARAWRERQGLPPVPRWDEVHARLAPLPVSEGRYLLSETQPDTYTNYPWEHPSLVGPLGMLPGDGADAQLMARTLDSVLASWEMKRVWGWDFPLLAMCAARLGRPAQAVDLLLTDSPNFQFAPNGFATGGPWPYFPSNGGLLYAVALMAGGWDGPGGDAPTPGFPKDGSWTVRAEGFARAP